MSLWASVGSMPSLMLTLLPLARSLRQGSPIYGATWKDEGLNRVIAQIARAVGVVYFEARVLLRFAAEKCGQLKRKRTSG